MNASRHPLIVALVLSVVQTAWAQLPADQNLKLNLPPGWTIRQSPQGALLVPPEVRSGARGAEEMYVVTVAPAPAGASLRDPHVARVAMEQIAASLTAFDQVSEPQVCNVGGDLGARLVLAGNDPASGRPLVAGVWLSIERGRMIVVTAAGTRDAVAGRLEAVDRIAADLRCDAIAAGAAPQPLPVPAPRPMPSPAPRPVPQPINPNLDPALIGVWQTSESESFVGPAPGEAFSMSTARVTTMFFNPDGTLVQNVRSQMSGGTYGVTYDSGQDPGQTYNYRWAARGADLCTQSSDGSVGQLRYQVSGDTLVTIGPRGQRTVYRRVR